MMINVGYIPIKINKLVIFQAIFNPKVGYILIKFNPKVGYILIKFSPKVGYLVPNIIFPAIFSHKVSYIHSSNGVKFWLHPEYNMITEVFICL